MSRMNRTLMVAVTAIAAVCAMGLAVVPAADAAVGSVVINEIFYNPTDLDDGDAEFFELHNPGTTDVDLTGYTIVDTDGPNGTLSGILPAGGYGIVTPVGYDALTRWGVAPIATFTNGLSGGGDTIGIKDAAGVVVDIVSYDDSAPWPGEADGAGPSIELIDALTDNAVPAAWADSVGGPTPGAVNSVTLTPPPPPISSVTATPFEPAVNQDITVVATIADGGPSPVLTYVVGFGPEVPITMNDAGVPPDVTAGDDVYAAAIPGQAAGELVRYRIDDPTTGQEFPTGDARNYAGVVVDDPNEIPTTMVEMEWFIPEVDYDTMFDDPRVEVIVFGSVLAVDGVVYDNMEVKIRGGSYARRTHDKQGLSFDMPSGVDLNRPDMVPYPIDEFALVSERGWSIGRPFSAWELYYAAGFPEVSSQHVRVQRNGNFYGVYRFSEKLDGTWRNNAGTDGGFYKVVNPGLNLSGSGVEKKQPDDNNVQPAIDLSAGILQADGPAKTDFLYNNIDIPNAVNFMAVTTIVGHFDSRVQNFYIHEDTQRTGLWQFYPWDLSNTFGVNGPTCTGDEVELTCVNSDFYNSMLAVPEFEDMVWRRIRTLVDGPFADGEIEALAGPYVQSVSAAEGQADDLAWVAVASYNTPAKINTELDLRRNGLLALPILPNSQAAAPGIVMNELTYSPQNGVEFLELYNPTGSSVDLSGWDVDGIGLTIPGGTVIPGGGYVVLTDSIPNFQAEYPDVDDVVLVQFDGGLKGGGELVELRTAEAVLIDSVEYDDALPWPTEPDLGVFSLSLFDPAFDNALPASWGVSMAPGGTPGRVNDTVPGATGPLPNVVLNEIHYNPTGGGVEFVELINADTVSIDISGWDLDGMGVVPPGTVLAPDEIFTLTEDLQLFQALYPYVDPGAVGEWVSGGLNGGGEMVNLRNELGQAVDSVEYDDVAPWPTAADGAGASLELIDVTTDNALGASWVASRTLSGTPGLANGGLLCGGLAITVDLGLGQEPTLGDDVIRGTSGADTIRGLAGNDTICGLGGDDLIYGGNGADVIFGGPGNDLLAGQADADLLLGETGNDTINGGNGDDVIWGGDGADDVRGQGGNDEVRGEDGLDQMFGGSGNDLLYTGSGGNLGTAALVSGGGNNDEIYGGDDDDFLLGISGLDRLYGGDGNDVLNGGNGFDYLYGEGGNDVLSGGADRDRLYGGDGDDDILGGTGDDDLYGESGDDVLIGQTGTDLCDGGSTGETAGDTASDCESEVDVP